MAQHYKRILFLLMLLAGHFTLVSTVLAQNVNVEEVLNFRDRKPLKISGSVSASTSYFTATQQPQRQPFTYQLTGTVSLSLYELLSIPLTFNLNNYGANWSYPSLPNRLSLHPSYKWVRAHIGDVAMSFGPYTLSGHQFTGGGVELTPGNWQVAAMGGRLLKAVDYSAARPGVLPNYNRWGYGVKARYTAADFYAGGTFFSARDYAGNPTFAMDSLGIYPKSNLAFGVEGGVSLIKELTFTFDYALSILTRNTRADMATHPTLLDRMLGRRVTTGYYHAFKADVSYLFLGNTVGVSYERISPDYETLGAYYFNSDYENVTLNYARALFSDRLSLALSGGVQHDDLAGQKAELNLRFVGSINLEFSPNEDISTSLSASSFLGHRNIKSTFDYINAQTPYDNLDTLNFTQISNSVDLNFNWKTLKREAQSHSLTASVSYQEAADRQGRYILPGNLTRFLNLSTGYGVDFIPIALNANLGLSASNNYTQQKNLFTIGPVFTLSKSLLEQSLSTGISLSYNHTLDEGKSLAGIYNIRWNASFRFLKQHNISANVAYQHRRLAAGSAPQSHSLIGQLSYGYTF